MCGTLVHDRPDRTVERQMHPHQVCPRILLGGAHMATYIDACGTKAQSPTAVTSLDSSEILPAISEKALYISQIEIKAESKVHFLN